MRFSIRDLTVAGLIASLYIVLSLVFLPISFGIYQIRVAEALTVLPFLTAAAIPGLYIGCLLANIIGGMGWLDIVFGPLVTLAAAFLTRSMFHLSRRPSSNVLALTPIILMWIGAVYLLSAFKITVGSVAGFCLSLVLFALLVMSEKKGASGLVSMPALTALRLLSVVIALGAAFLLRLTDDVYFLVAGGIMLMAAVLTATILARVWFTGKNPHVLIAPLPPVILNAFGVSAYLAPLIGVNYWFSVQMVGIGQLIACYLIGLPVLLLLKERKLFPINNLSGRS